MKIVGAILFLFCWTESLACLPVLQSELMSFFSQSPTWTEVKTKNSFEIERRNPVFIIIDFSQQKNTRIRWGEREIAGSELKLCWQNSSKNALVIRRGLTKLVLTKVSSNLITSWLPVEGTLYFRKQASLSKK